MRCDARFRIAVIALLATAGPAAATEPSAVTPELIAAAAKEGKVVWYGSEDLQLVTAVARAFEAKYPGLSAQAERSGAERNFQRVSQEYASNIHAVDVVTSSDPGPIVFWKRNGMLAPFVPADVQAWPASARDPEGYYAVDCLTLSPIAYNTRLVKAAEAPTGFAELLDPKWKGKLVKAHPGYSGTIVTATLALSHALGWEFFEKLGRQQVMQVQSAIDPPRKVGQGERAAMADGAEASAFQVQAAGGPLALVYPSEGTPAAPLNGAIFSAAPHPNAARLFALFLYSREGQQIFVEYGFRSLHPEVHDPAGRTPLADIKLLWTDPVEQEAVAEEIKKRYAAYFGT
ncbi:MAG: extracellular solute-binding protein [Alphaproteobacteria bacterium]|nr:extracellular solute-binding protein [Alphaproteobacteria bacterium]